MNNERKEIAMKKVRVAINGFGRIGRLVLRAALESGRKDIEIVAINDITPIEQNVYLLQYDSVHGKLPMDVKQSGDYIIIGKNKIKCLMERDPSKLPWKKLNIDIVMECTGLFTSADKARVHIDCGAKRVLISAPSVGADKTIVFGVNENKLTKKDIIVSNASCTTNCLAPVLNILDKKFGVKNGWMTTVHSYTGDQQLLDKNHKDFRRARAANLSIVPTSTGAAKTIGLILPKLAGKMDGISVRVPTPDVSLIELMLNMKKKISVEYVNKLFTASQSNIIGTSDKPLVSVDYTHDSHSAIVDTALTRVVDNNVLHVTAWYDNEWGFSNRMCDTAVAMGKLI